MGKIKDIFEGNKHEKLIVALFDTIGKKEKGWDNIEGYEMAITLSYQNFIDEHKKLYPEIERKDIELLKILEDFSESQNEIYLCIGFILGYINDDSVQTKFEKLYENLKINLYDSL